MEEIELVYGATGPPAQGPRASYVLCWGGATPVMPSGAPTEHFSPLNDALSDFLYSQQYK